jgi:hypothetical protein
VPFKINYILGFLANCAGLKLNLKEAGKTFLAGSEELGVSGQAPALAMKFS